MGSPVHIRGYNERLFSGGIRSYFHFARFHWVRNEIQRLGISTESVIELGCYDGRLLDFIPRPKRYVGYDANWESGLDFAVAKFAGEAAFTFLQAQTPADISTSEKFAFGASLETLEHIPPDLVDGYLSELAKRIDGYFLATVPNETGPVFLAKWAVKRVFNMSPKQYSAAEIFNAFIGRTERVKRHEHKGFNYRDMVRQIGRHFDVLQVQGFPLSVLPPALCFGVGITAKRSR